MSRTLAISVIDDDESFRLALVGSLRSLGYDTRGFASVEEFVAGDGEASSDGVITDLHMPGMSGIDLIRQLKAQGSALPVILITGRPEPGLEAKAAAAGAACLLRKPFETDALIDCLEKAL
ncbi:response regulator transcription factor [Bradyrhizobium sp.]|uniref:response regulator transcription factor n=1 Tax=Bradyrhizobium sp. TaxID=376 RepID=UPI003C5501AD